MSTRVVAVERGWVLRWRVLQRLARQELREALLGWGFYLTASAALVLSVFLVYNSVRFAGESGLNILTRPFFLPLFAAASLILLYVTVGATLAIARPREQGMLQVLFFAPVDAPTLVGAQFLAGIAVYSLLVLLLVPLLLFLAWITNFVVPESLLWGLVPVIFVAGLGVAFGLFVSAAAPSGRAAVLLFVAVSLLLLALQAGYAALLNIPPTSRFYDALLFVRVVLRYVNEYLVWVSPFHMLDETLRAALRYDWAAQARYLFAALAGIVFWLAAAVWAVRKRGVLP